MVRLDRPRINGMKNSLTFKYFPLISGAVIVVAGVILGALYTYSVRADLSQIAERNNVSMAHAISNYIWPRIDTFVLNANTLAKDQLRRHPKLGEIRDLTHDLVRETPVLKIKIYDLNGLTVFSSDPTQIGQNSSGNAGFRAARNGTVASELTHRDRFSAFEQQVEDRDVLSSYIPIRLKNDEIRGVFEIYYDVTHLLARIKFSQQLQITVVALTLALLYLMILRLVRHRDRLIENHHIDRVALFHKNVKVEEASRAKSDFLAKMSHELRTPLNAIIGFTDALRMKELGAATRAKSSEYLDYIASSSQHLLALVEDILDMSRIEFGKSDLQLTEISLQDITNECIGMLSGAAERETPTIQTRIASPSPILRVDERRFKQVLINLFSNAIKFTPAGGEISLSAEPTTPGGLKIRIQDTGIGIAKQDIDKVLTPFGQVDRNVGRRGAGAGLGLGLSLAQSLVELHGGILDLDSTLGKGTSVTITLPAEFIVTPAHTDAAGS